MSAKERILMIRLLEKVSKHPVYAGTLGIEVLSAMGASPEPERGRAEEAGRIHSAGRGS